MAFGKRLTFNRPVGLYQAIGRRLTPALRTWAKDQMRYAGSPDDPDAWMGMIACYSVAFGLVCAFVLAQLLPYASQYVQVVAFTAGIIAADLAALTSVQGQIEDRRNRIERILPDALNLTSANIRAGMTPIVALRMAARPEFGPLEEEIRYATTRSLGTESITDILSDMSRNVQSMLFSRAVNLLASSLKGGGKLTELLDRLAEEIREIQELRNELRTNTMLYVLFILFTTSVGTPVLLAVSYHFSGMVLDMQKSNALTDVSGLGLNLVVASPLTPDFISFAALGIIVASAIMASAFIGVVHEGKEISGFKYAPFIAVTSLLVFFLMRDFVLQFVKIG